MYLNKYIYIMKAVFSKDFKRSDIRLKKVNSNFILFYSILQFIHFKNYNYSIKYCACTHQHN